MGILDDTAAIYEGLAARSDKCCVFFSGGKDSLVILDYATRFFDRSKIHACFMELVPGLEVLQRPLDEAEARFGVPIKRLPHWLSSRILRTGAYCDKDRSIPEWGLNDVYAAAMEDAGTDCVITGARAADSPTRRRYIGSAKGKQEHIVYPILGWGIYDVKGYLKMRKIPIPETSNANATGVDLSTKSLLWLYENHKEDFDRMAEYFTYIEAVVVRERLYGEKA